VVENGHDIGGEVRHVLGHEERQVTQLVLLLEHNLVLELGSRPHRVFWDGDQVGRPRENTDWEFDIAHFILRSIAQTVSVDVGLDSAVVESLELLFGKRNGLPIVEPVSVPGSGWSVVDHVQERLVVVNCRVRVNDHARENIAEFAVEQTANVDCASGGFVTEWNQVVLPTHFENELQNSESVVSEEAHTLALDSVEGGDWGQENSVVDH